MDLPPARGELGSAGAAQRPGFSRHAAGGVCAARKPPAFSRASNYNVISTVVWQVGIDSDLSDHYFWLIWHFSATREQES